MRITEVKLTKKQRVELEYIEHFDSRPFMQKRSRIILDKSRWHALKEDSGKAVVLGTQGQPLGQTVSRTRYRWSAKQTGTRSQPIMDSSDEEAVRHAIEKDRSVS